MGRYVFANELALHGLDGPAVAVVSRMARAYRPTVDDLLATTPSDAEVMAIRRDFNIWFSPGVPSRNVQLGVYNVFRAMRLIAFDSPIPLLGETNVYRWLKQTGVAIEFFHDDGTGIHHAAGGVLHMNDITFDPPAQAWSHLRLASAVLLHEAWHVCVSGREKQHDRDLSCRDVHGAIAAGTWCCANDSSLRYGGAWAAQYWYLQWLATHSGSYLSTEEKQAAADNANAVRSTRICGG